MSNNIWIWDNPEKYLQRTSYAHEWTDSNMHERTAYLTQAWPIMWDHHIISYHIRHVDCTDKISGSLGWWCIGKPAHVLLLLLLQPTLRLSDTCSQLHLTTALTLILVAQSLLCHNRINSPRNVRHLQVPPCLLGHDLLHSRPWSPHSRCPHLSFYYWSPSMCSFPSLHACFLPTGQQYPGSSPFLYSILGAVASLLVKLLVMVVIS